ncbi:MAG: galactokinase [Oscillospiraceae bacterium]|jgi:galactokinase|nr:galactokinase [Oscillospiraceae bacterium]
MHTPTVCRIDGLYGTNGHNREAEAEKRRERYEALSSSFRGHFGAEKSPLRFFSAPGRTEIGGNHTDHNGGKVLAAAVNLDIIAAVEPIDENKIVVKSEGFEENGVWLDDLEPANGEKNTSEAIIRGIAKGFSNAGYKTGGFKAYTVSEVIKGSGLSSSAAFEVLVGTVLSHLFNGGKVAPMKIAQIAGFAENEYFGKPSGLMDQITSSVGGFVAIDFKEGVPVIETVKADFDAFGHALCIIDTKGSHDGLTADYAAVANEMKSVAAHFGVDCLRKICRQDIILNMGALRAKFGDRAVLRSLHFFDENIRVDKLVHALKNGDFPAFLDYINESGSSSCKYLQNIYSPDNVKNQPLGIGLNVAEVSLSRNGACRVHGGGFAGTVQAFVPRELLKEFKMNVETVFGAGSCHILTVRNTGGTEVVVNREVEGLF